MVYKIIFSPTGGTDKVAQILCENLDTEIVTVDLSDADFAGCTMENDAIAVVAMPSFGGRAPKTAIDRLKTVKARSNKAVVVAVYGNREQEDTLIEISDAAVECGFNVIAGISAVAEHSIAHRYAAGRPDAEDTRQLVAFADKIKAKASDDSTPAIPGNRPYKKAGAGMVPKTSSACTSCGLCVAKCPVAAIDKTAPKHIDKNACIGCMRCVSVCPQKAKKVSPLMVKLVEAALKKSCTARKENTLYL